MCTVTLVPWGVGFRLRCNRDERRDRPPAAPPVVHKLRRQTAIFPDDPAGPGTWIGVNTSGVAAALLNRAVTVDARNQQAIRSRGLIIPALLDGRCLPEAIDIGARLDPSAFGPFCILVVQGGLAAVLSSDRAVVTIECTPFTRPMMLTSSSLGDALVDQPRRRLFDRMFAGDPRSWRRAQREFHRHRWPQRRDISVMMERVDARTVSQTLVTVGARTVAMRYRALEEPKHSAPGRA